MKNISLSAKLIIFFMAVGIIPFAISNLISLPKASNALDKQAFNQLEGMREVKKSQIEQFFAEREGDMGVLVETVGTLRQEAINKLIAIREIKKAQIEGFFSERIGDARVLADNPFIGQAMRELNAALEAEGGIV